MVRIFFSCINRAFGTRSYGAILSLIRIMNKVEIVYVVSKSGKPLMPTKRGLGNYLQINFKIKQNSAQLYTTIRRLNGFGVKCNTTYDPYFWITRQMKHK